MTLNYCQAGARFPQRFKVALHVEVLKPVRVEHVVYVGEHVSDMVVPVLHGLVEREVSRAKLGDETILSRGVWPELATRAATDRPVKDRIYPLYRLK